MTKNNQYNTLSLATEALKKKGYVKEVEVINEHQICIDNDKKIKADEVKIKEFHRFEGLSNPSDSSVVYAIKSNSGQKGLLIDAYGADASATKAAFLKKVSVD